MSENKLNIVSVCKYNILVKFGAFVFLWHFFFCHQSTKTQNNTKFRTKDACNTVIVSGLYLTHLNAIFQLLR